MQRKTFRQSKKLMGKKLGEEWVFLHLENGRYYGLNETGSIFWDELKTYNDSGKVLDRLEKIFDVERETLEKDLTQFLQQLGQEGLIKIENLSEKA